MPSSAAVSIPCARTILVSSEVDFSARIASLSSSVFSNISAIVICPR